MKILVNDKERLIDKETITVEEFLSELHIEKEGIAVCVNGDIVKRAGFCEFIIKDGDRVDIITMVGGG